MFKWLLSTECNLTLNHYLHVCHEFLVKNWDIEKTPTFFMINRTKESYQLVTFVPNHESSQVITQTKIIFCFFIGNIWTSCRTSLMDLTDNNNKHHENHEGYNWTCRKSQILLINSYQEEVSNFMWLFLEICYAPKLIIWILGVPTSLW